MPRKTYPVEKLKAGINRQLARHDLTAETRLLLAEVLETVLMETDNYHGFNDVHWMTGGADAWRAAGEPEFPEKNTYIHGTPDGADIGRRHYF